MTRLADAALKVIRREGRGRRGPKYCYTDESGRHCFVAEIILELGGRLPAPESDQNRARFSYTMAKYEMGLLLQETESSKLVRLQQLTDNNQMWGEAYDAVFSG